MRLNNSPEILMPLIFLVPLLSVAPIVDQGDSKANVSNPSGTNCNDGSIDLMIENGIGPFDFGWQKWDGSQGQFFTFYSVFEVDGSDGQEDVSELERGRYLVSVTDAFCGVASARVFLTAGLNKVSLVPKENANLYDSNNPTSAVCDGAITATRGNVHPDYHG